MSYKLLHHVYSLNQGLPVSLSVSLTGRCNLSCDFCYIKNRNKEDLCIGILKQVINCESFRGIIKSVEFGMGEPTLHPKINEVIELCWKNLLSIGMGTNGTCLFNIKKENLSKIDWMILAITHYIDNEKYIDWNFIPNKVNFVYVLHKNSPEPDVLIERFDKFFEINKKLNLEIKLDINAKDRDTIANFYYMEKMLNRPYYKFTTAQGKFKPFKGDCHYTWLKPLLHNDGWLYGCCIATEDGDYPKWNRICKWNEIDKVFPTFDTSRDCKKCSKVDRLNMINDFHKDKNPEFII